MRLCIRPTWIGDGKIYLELTGELVLGEESTARLRALLHAYFVDEVNLVCISMAGVSKMDAAGIGELVRAHAIASECGARMELRGLSPIVHGLLVLCKLLTVFGPEACNKAA